jgi:hypothetical protein
MDKLICPLFKPEDCDAAVACVVLRVFHRGPAVAYNSKEPQHVLFDDWLSADQATPARLQLEALWFYAAVSELQPELATDEFVASALAGHHGIALTRVAEATVARWAYYAETPDTEGPADGHAL